MAGKVSPPVAAPGAAPRPRGPMWPRPGWLRTLIPGAALAGRTWGRWRRTALRALAGVALVLAGAVVGLAAGQTMASRSAHRAGACNALNVAAALGYLDAEQRRRVRHALATALNPDADLFSAGGASRQAACDAGGEG